mmetsp:Transcript_45498/g.110754  ORF Transcript_45498/g.110754 Transcript_45498/m.110754 type:complete len:224 (-) Transcript_45498:44-715(-)
MPGGRAALLALLVLALVCAAAAFAPPEAPLGARPRTPALRRMRKGAQSLRASGGVPVSRRAVLGGAVGAAVLGAGAPGRPAAAEGGGAKRTGLSNEELAELVRKDIVDKQFMVTGDLTRELYSEDCTFQDEIDTYKLEKWIDGTRKLFKNEYSHMDLDGPVTVTDKKVEFRFKERLMFNIPYLKPKVPLTGKLELTRGEGGLFTKYKETWDEPVWKVIVSLRP